MVCGMLRSGGKVPKSGVYRLHKGEQVFTPGQLKNAAHTKTKKHTRQHKKKGCSCKH
jgi:hypothetical protein